MRNDFLESIICPTCKERDFLIEITEVDDLEIKNGKLLCGQCGIKYAIKSGVVFLYQQLGAAALKERQTLEKELTAKLIAAHNDDWLLNFPDNKKLGIDDRAERMTRLSADNVLSFLKNYSLVGKKILELGSGNTWLTARLAAANYCVASDIFTQAPKGLESANTFIKHQGLFYERVVSDMKDLPFHDQVFDLVIINAALHHSSDLDKTLKEIYRVLTSQGRLILLNEPSLGLFGSQERQKIAEDVIAGINENRYTLKTWRQAFVNNNFLPRIYLPENFFNVVHSKGKFFRVFKYPLKLMPGLEKFIINHFSSPVLIIFDGFFNAVLDKASTLSNVEN